MGAIILSGSNGKMRRRLVWVAWTLMVLIMSVGCAANQAVPAAPAEEQPTAAEQKTITRLDGGRIGFIITETQDSTVSWRNEFDRAVVLLQDNKEAEAIPLLEEIVRQEPRVTAPYINLAIAYRHTEQYDRAEEQLQMALQLVPEHPVANNEFGLLLRETGRFTEAREAYESILQTFPEYLPAHRNLGILCEIYLGDLACALEQYTIYNEANPEDQDVPVWIADLNLRMGHN